MVRKNGPGGGMDDHGDGNRPEIPGQLVGGYVGPSTGWRMPFIIVSVPTLIFLAIFFAAVKEPRRGAAEEGVESLVAQGLLYPRSIRFRDYLRLFKIRTNLFLFLQGILGTIPWGADALFIVKFLNENKSLSIEAATTAFLLFGVGNVATVLGGLAGGPLLRRKPAMLPRFCAITTLLGAGITLYMFLGLPQGSLVWTLILGFLAAFFASMTGPNMRTMLLDTNVPENRGAIFSIFNLTDSVQRHRQVRGGRPVDFRRPDCRDFELCRVLDSLRDSPVDRRIRVRRRHLRAAQPHEGGRAGNESREGDLSHDTGSRHRLCR